MAKEEEKAILLRLRGGLKNYFEEQKKRIETQTMETQSDNSALREMIKEHKRIIEMKY
jgi:hypothetical protein